jgi:hypothetical protein
MLPVAVLLVGSMVAAPPGAARLVPLRLERGQEFIYHANYTQEGGKTTTSLSRFLDTYVLILQVSPSIQAAFMTVQRIEGRPGSEPIPIVRLEFGRIDSRGRVTIESTSDSPFLPIDGPPTLETAPFLELPETLPQDRIWQVSDPELGPETWRILMENKLELGWCHKLKGEQSSGNWNAAQGLVWNRDEYAWLLQYEGIVARIERVTDWRTPAGERFHSTCVIELESVPATLGKGQFDDRYLEIRDYLRFSRDLAELMKPRGEPDIRGYDDLLQRIDRHLDRGTPYGIAFRSLRRRAEAARNGERPPEPIVIPGRHELAAPLSQSATIGVDQPAPALTLRDARTGESTSLLSLRRQPTILLFMQPSADTTDKVIRYARTAAKVYAGRAHVVLLAAEGEPADVTRIQKAYHLEIPIYEGRDVLSRFDGHSLPRVVVLDGKGVVRMIEIGWRDEYMESIYRQLVAILQEK